ncbi:unnamed protein product [Bursaphelenchus xylophilus]|uniref:(pine wood nematode) hypothetical protein n=1 Tax=Bursaphelenchus xylophilus TaxID=6326 RepID=A0A1I7SAK0_BURXY|nr:unnamed protein product [Bursaphelenchus xylophilus]CAG9079296.1 unnamed protein product [Bursaphelenchus xylophilus]
MGKILVVGLCCLDVVNYVQKFPKEDSDTRVFEMETVLGGNAANNCTVLGQFDAEATVLCAALPNNDPMLEKLISEYHLNVIRINREKNRVPISTCIVNLSNGTRTILHFRGDIGEITAKEFEEKFTDLSEYSWIHFEGRNFDELDKIIEYCKAKIDKNRCKISVELEKIRDFDWYTKIIPLADVIFISKDFSRNLGFNSMNEAINGFVERFRLQQTTVIVPWGEEGASARIASSPSIFFEPAFKPEKLVDTLGAGDSFIGSALYFLNNRNSLQNVLKNAVKVAGTKCGQRGLRNLSLDIIHDQ